MNHQNGQDEAWLQTVFERFEAPLVGYATRLVGDAERGRDIVQDVFLRLCQNGPHDSKDHIAAWLFRVCRNRALDVCRKERRMGPLSPDNSTAHGPDPAHAAERQDDVSQVRAVLQRLPKNQQEVVRLKIEHGLKYREIGEVTGLSVSNVGYLLHQALQAMRRDLCQQSTQ